MRLTAFLKICKMCTLLRRSKLNILAKNLFFIKIGVDTTENGPRKGLKTGTLLLDFAKMLTKFCSNFFFLEDRDCRNFPRIGRGIKITQKLLKITQN